MRTTFSLTLLTASLSTLAVCQPTRSRESRAEHPVASSSAPSAPGTTKIPLTRRGTSELTKRDGTLDWAKANAHLARAQSKYSRSVQNVKRNSPTDAVLLARGVDEHDDAAFLARRAWATEGDTLDWNSDDARVILGKRDDKIFGGAAAVVRGKKQPKAVPVNPSASIKLPNLAIAVVKNPKAVYNPKVHAISATASIGSSGGVGLTEQSGGTVWTGSVSIGTPAVAYTLDFDTGSADLWVPSASCNSAACNPHTKYDPTKSSTSATVAGAQLSISYGDGSSTTGTVYKDTITIAGLTATGQTFGAADSMSSDWQDDPMDGIFGMGYQAISQLNTPPVFQTLIKDGAVAKSQFSFKLGASGPELFLGGMNPSLYVSGTTSWYPVTSQAYWTISATANVAGTPVSALGSFNAIIDTGTSVVVAPTASAATFWGAVPGSAVYGSGYYTYPCATPPSLSFSFGSGSDQWVISGDTLNLGKVSSGSSRCVGSIVGADLGLKAWVIGDSFLENVYATFDLSTNRVGFSELS